MRFLSKTTVVLLTIAAISAFAPANAAGPDKPLNLDANGRVIKKHCKKGSYPTATNAPTQVGVYKKGARNFSSALDTPRSNRK